MLPLSVRLLACTLPPPEQPDRAGFEPDVFNVRLDQTADLCAYEDTAPAVPPPAESGYVAVDDDPFRPCLDGLLEVGVRILDAPEGRVELHGASATFFAVEGTGNSFREGIWLDPLDAVDDCGVITLGPNGYDHGGDVRWLDPGEVAIEGPWGRSSMIREPGGLSLNYHVLLSDEGIAGAFGQAYGLSVGGPTEAPVTTRHGGEWEAFDAIEIPEAVVQPERLEVLAPADLALGVGLPRIDTEVRWTGTSDGTVSIAWEGWVKPQWYELHCNVEDDGSFVIPGAVLELMPAGLTINVTVSREHHEWLGTRNGRSIHAIGHSGHQGWAVLTE